MAKEFNIKDYLGETVWSEDDAPEHGQERMHTALPRITGLSHKKKERSPELVVDYGDCEWEIHKDWVLCFSYPGNNAIYKRKK